MVQRSSSQKRAGDEFGLRAVVCPTPRDGLAPGNPFAVPLNLPSSKGRCLEVPSSLCAWDDPAERLLRFQSFGSGPSLPLLSPLRALAVLRRGAEPGVVRLGGLRGLRGRARGRPGAGEGAGKLEPNQHGVQLPSPNLQVTPRGGGGGDRSPQQRRAPPGGEEASWAPRHRQPGCHSDPGLGGSRGREPGRGGYLCPPRPGGRGRGRAPLPPPPLPPRRLERWRCAWLRRRRRRREARLGAARAALRRGSGGGGGCACGSGCGREARCSPCSPASCCCCCCACSGARPTRPPAPGNPPPRAPGGPRPPPPPVPLGRADFRSLRGRADGQRRPEGGVGRGRPGGGLGAWRVSEGRR